MLATKLHKAGIAIALTAATAFSTNGHSETGQNTDNTVSPDPNITELFQQSDLKELNHLTYMESDWIIDIGSVNGDNADQWIENLHNLALSDPDHPIIIRIKDSPGGSTRHGLNFIDALHAIPNPVMTLCSEKAASMAAVILYTLRNGIRVSTENCAIMSHAPYWPDLGRQTYSSIENILANGKRSLNAMAQYTADASGLSLEDSLKLYTDNDLHLTPRQAMGAGLIDVIIPHRTNYDSRRNQITVTTNASEGSQSVTRDMNASDFKNLFCDATKNRQLDYCSEQQSAPAQEYTPTSENAPALQVSQ